MNKMQKLMAAIEELERMHRHCLAVQDAAQGTKDLAAADRAILSIEDDMAELRRQLVEAINAHPETHSLTPHV